MRIQKYLLIFLFGTFTYSLQAWEYYDTVRAVAVFIGCLNPLEIVDGVEREVLNSRQAHNLLQYQPLAEQEKIEYKKFKIAEGDMKTQHIVNGYMFDINGRKYIVRSAFHNTEKVYHVSTSLFGSPQINVTSTEALAIMNDSKYLTYTNYEIIGLFGSYKKSSVVEYDWQYKSGILVDGSVFTSNGIHYVVSSY